jgi:pimeloyl-ACP methyl ester carboxylesterase
MAQHEKAQVSAEALQAALNSVAGQLGIHWADWSGEAALRRLTQPVLLIGGEKDVITTANDLKVLEQASPPGSRSILIPEANHQFIAFWLHDLSKPVATWFGEHLPRENELHLAGG